MKRSTLVYQFQLQVAVVLIKLPHAATSHKDFLWKTSETAVCQRLRTV